MSQNYLYMNRKRGEQLGFEDLQWVWIESHNGKIKAQLKLMEGVNSDTVWTWNAIAKQRGAWALSENAPESERGFLMNHLIAETLPESGASGVGITNSDPVTGQAAWYDLRVKISHAEANDERSLPRFDTIRRTPGQPEPVKKLRYAVGKQVNLRRSLKDVLMRGLK